MATKDMTPPLVCVVAGPTQFCARGPVAWREFDFRPLFYGPVRDSLSAAERDADEAYALWESFPDPLMAIHIQHAPLAG